MPNRREWLAALAATGVGSATFQRALAATADEASKQPEKKPTGITAEMIEHAEWVAGIQLTPSERRTVAATLTRISGGLRQMRSMPLPNEVAPAVHFHPAPTLTPTAVARGLIQPSPSKFQKPAKDEDLFFASIADQRHLLRTKQISSVELTKLYIARLKQLDPLLNCVVRFTDDLALKQAEQADRELAAGTDRGPLHGIPWAAKDLIAYPGYPTTWGAGHYQHQQLNTKATVAKKLEDAGAVMIAKTTLGALALGDQWFGGRTNNPWNLKQGSSGSSAGSASAGAAGAVGFAIGSETLGSIISPSTRCGVTGLRPTFGRVSRAGCMTLSWTLDKLGPMTRSVEDCALILDAIHGADPGDPAAVDQPFSWPGRKSLKELRVGTFAETSDEVKKVLTDLGVKLVPMKLPSEWPLSAMVNVILDAECASAFDDLTRSGVRDGLGPWPSTFMSYRFISAIDYLRANRLRTQLMAAMAEAMKAVDVYVGGNDLVLTNLTGHPTICMPNGFTTFAGAKVPTAITFTGQLYGETNLLTVAKAYQDATGHHRVRPKIERPTE